MKRHEYSAAVTHLDKATTFTTTHDIYYKKYECCIMTGQESRGIAGINEICNTQPSLLKPRMILMRYHDRHGDTAVALRYAMDIKDTEPRIDNEEARRIKRMAEKFVRRGCER